MTGYMMPDNPFIDGLELSVRASNVLRAWGRVNSIDDFLALDRKTVMTLPNAGVRTWREIEKMQAYLRGLSRTAPVQEQGGPAYPIPKTDTHDTWPSMSLRDAAALAALPVLIDICRADTREPGETLEQMFARKALAVADAFIAARDAEHQ